MEKLRLGHLVFELTESCNQNCRFCYNYWRPEGSRPVDTRLAGRTLGRLLRQARIDDISFSGGEPMLLSNVHDLALKCRFKGSAVNVLSNGTLLSEDDIINFRSLGIGGLQIPLLSSDSAVHDSLTGLPGSWNKAMRAIHSAIDILGPEHVVAVLILTVCNIDSLMPTLRLYDELGVRTVMVNRFNLGGNGLIHREELCLNHSQLRSAFRLVSDFSLGRAEISFVSGVCTPLCVLEPLDYPGIRFSCCSTDLAHRPVTINYRGDVRFCNHSPFVLGNIYERSLRDILEDDSIRERYSSVPEECSSCRLYHRCRGGCRAASEQVYGTFSRVDPFR